MVQQHQHSILKGIPEVQSTAARIFSKIKHFTLVIIQNLGVESIREALPYGHAMPRIALVDSLDKTS